MKTYEINNRTFETMQQAIKYADSCDFSHDCIIEVDSLKKEYIKDSNGYNLQQLQDAIRLLENFNITVTHKKFHTPKYWELVELIENNLESINRFLFTRDSYGMKTYKDVLTSGGTKKELDKYLKYSINEFIRSLYAIINDFY